MNWTAISVRYILENGVCKSDLGVRWPELNADSWSGYLIHLCSSHLICKMGIIMVITSQALIKSENSYKVSF